MLSRQAVGGACGGRLPEGLRDRWRTGSRLGRAACVRQGRGETPLAERAGRGRDSGRSTSVIFADKNRTLT